MAAAKKKKAARQEPARDEARPLFREGELPPAPDRFAKEAFDIYNEVAARVGWPVTENLTEVRQKKLIKAIHDCGSVAKWRVAIERAGASAFLTGKKKTIYRPMGFIAKLDFFLRSDKRTMLLDGEYDDKAMAPNPMKEIRAMTTPIAKPKDEPFVSTETLEDRKRAMITSYRKYGRFADANRIESELAVLEDRPAVLVPDPSVAAVGMPEKPPVQRDQPKPAPFAKPNGSAAPGPCQPPTVSDLPGWLDEAIPDSAYGDA